MKRSKVYNTDRFTRGGQIFAHEWRMRFQNMRTVLLLSLLFALGGFCVGMILFKEGWVLGQFFFLDYLPAWIKATSWPYLQDFFEGLDQLLKALNPKSKGLMAYKGLQGMTSEIRVMNGLHYKVNTLEFLNHPWTTIQLLKLKKCLWSMLGCWVLGIFYLIWAFKKKSARLEADKILKGKTLERVEVVAQKVRKLGKPDFEIAQGLPLPKGSENQHLALIGSTRMGKTNCILGLLNQIRQKSQRAIILDATGELTSIFYRPHHDKLLNPFDARSSSWTIWNENLPNYEYDAWASTMIPEGKGDPIWHGNARKLLSFTAQKLKSEKAPMKDILRWCCSEPLGKRTMAFYKDSPIAAIMTPEAEKTAAGIRMQAGNSIAAFEYLEGKDPPLSIITWVKDGKNTDGWLFLTATSTQRSTLAPLLASWFNFSFLGLERAGIDFKNRLWMVADELAGWDFPISSLKRMVSEGAKYGACCLLGFQNKSQIDAIYGHATTKTLLSNCNTKVIFRSQDHETAKDLSLTLGEQDILASTENFSIGANQIRDGVNLAAHYRSQATISATEIMGLNPLEAFVMLSGNYPATKATFTLNKLPKQQPEFIAKA